MSTVSRSIDLQGFSFLYIKCKGFFEGRDLYWALMDYSMKNKNVFVIERGFLKKTFFVLAPSDKTDEVFNALTQGEE